MTTFPASSPDAMMAEADIEEETTFSARMHHKTNNPMAGEGEPTDSSLDAPASRLSRSRASSIRSNASIEDLKSRLQMSRTNSMPKASSMEDLRTRIRRDRPSSLHCASSTENLAKHLERSRPSSLRPSFLDEKPSSSVIPIVKAAIDEAATQATGLKSAPTQGAPSDGPLTGTPWVHKGKPEDINLSMISNAATPQEITRQSLFPTGEVNSPNAPGPNADSSPVTFELPPRDLAELNDSQLINELQNGLQNLQGMVQSNVGTNVQKKDHTDQISAEMERLHLELKKHEELLKATEARAEEAMQLAEMAMNERDILQNQVQRLLSAKDGEESGDQTKFLQKNLEQACSEIVRLTLELDDVRTAQDYREMDKRITVQEAKRLQLRLEQSEAKQQDMQRMVEQSAQQLAVAYNTIQLMRERSAVQVTVKKEIKTGMKVGKDGKMIPVSSKDEVETLTWYTDAKTDKMRTGEWTAEEDRKLIEAQTKLGDDWVEIVKFLPGRTDMAAEQHWLDLMQQSAMAGQEDTTPAYSVVKPVPVSVPVSSAVQLRSNTTTVSKRARNRPSSETFSEKALSVKCGDANPETVEDFYAEPIDPDDAEYIYEEPLRLCRPEEAEYGKLAKNFSRPNGNRRHFGPQPQQTVL